MPKAFPHSHIVDGTVVGFSVKKFDGDTYIACFRDRDGRRRKLDTQQARIGQAVETARLLIEKTLRAKILPTTMEWDAAVGRLKARLAIGGIRDTTIGYYEKVIRSVRGMYPECKGPADVTSHHAEQFRDRMMSVVTSEERKPRSAHYVAGLIGGLNALWQK